MGIMEDEMWAEDRVWKERRRVVYVGALLDPWKERESKRVRELTAATQSLENHN